MKTKANREETFFRVLEEAMEGLRAEGLPFLVIGSLASVVLGYPKWDPDTVDIDFFVRNKDADAALDAFDSRGFATKKPDQPWLYKAEKDDIPIDVIFRHAGDVYLDDEMLERMTEREFKGVKLPLVSPEDFVVMKALAFSDETPLYWHEAVGVMVHSDLDWEYLLKRARHGQRRILALLIYADSEDVAVPPAVIRRLAADAVGD